MRSDQLHYRQHYAEDTGVQQGRQRPGQKANRTYRACGGADEPLSGSLQCLARVLALLERL